MEGAETTGRGGDEGRGKSGLTRDEMLAALSKELDETESLVPLMERAPGSATKEKDEGRDAASFGFGYGYGLTGDVSERDREYDRDHDESDDEGGETATGGAFGGEPTSRRWLSRRASRLGAAFACLMACAATLTTVEPYHQRRARRYIRDTPLGEMDCESAFVPAVAGQSMTSNPYRIAGAPEHIYILTTQNCSSPDVNVRVPVEWAEKASCVSGKFLDLCTAQAVGVWYESHYTRVSIAHGMIVKHAKESGFKHITVIEDDTEFNDQIDVKDETVEDVMKLLAGDAAATSALGRVKLEHKDFNGESIDWNVLRPAFRPHLFEKFEARPSSTGTGWVEVTTGVRDDIVCPVQCHCLNVRMEGQLCMLTSSGCDLRSSDMYILHSRAYDEMLDVLFTGTSDTIIDHFVLQNMEHTWLIHPSLTIQNNLDIDNELQRNVQRLFEEKCER